METHQEVSPARKGAKISIHAEAETPVFQPLNHAGDPHELVKMHRESSPGFAGLSPRMLNHTQSRESKHKLSP